MIMPSSSELKVFYSYSHKDQGYRQQLENHLASLKRLYHLQTWFDRQIKPGDNWQGVLEEHLNSADLIFLLISADFMNSDYCYNKEMARALERHARGEAKVIPILVRPVHWKKAPFSHIQLLPTNAQPIKNWANPDKAYYNVVIGVERVVQDLLAIRGMQEERLEDENTLENLKGYEEGLAPLGQSERLDADSALDYVGKGMVLRNQKRYDEALAAYEQAIQQDPTFVNAHIGKGNALNELKRYDEALASYEQAILLDPHSANTYRRKGAVLDHLKRHQEAEEAYEMAGELEENQE